MTMAMGLEGVIAASTVLSDVDGERGRLIVRGATIESLAGHVPFEGVAARLWQDLAPGEVGDTVATTDRLGLSRCAAYERLAPIFGLAASRSPLEGLRLALAALSEDDCETPHLLATGAVPVVLAAILRIRNSQAPIAPDAGLGHAHDFLRMATGASVPAQVAALDAYLATVAEHGMNASTFTARVIASTRAGVIAAVVGALCALAGPLHGGAPGPVLDMLDDIGTYERIGPWLEDALSRGDRLMGFGHRVYRVRDPRADVLKAVVGRMRAGGDARLAFAEAVEREALAMLAIRKPGRRLDTNVEFFTALLLEALGLPRDSFTAVFAMGRVAGWTAHAHEQMRDGRLMRPMSAYVGPQPLES
jgi:citrate synthase